VLEAVHVRVNGTPRTLSVAQGTSLLASLRDQLGLTGAKLGCAEGVCGVCTVLLDGEPIRACVTPVEAAAGREVTTIEGLAVGGRLHPVQRAFVEEGGFQCGYCTPGMVLETAALLGREPAPSDAAIVAALDGHLCRCCTYPSILRAARRAVALDAGGAVEEAAVRPIPRPARPLSSLPVADRDFFAVLPDGLVVVAARPEDAAGWGTCSEAWVHVGADGTVTAFSGKVDVGQGNGGAFAALVAEELGVDVADVRLVLGDTDLCPYDAGTFGSRSLPDSAPLLTAAAAAAREALRRGVSGLVVTTTAEPRSPAAWRVAGTPFRRERIALVTGALRFPSDMTVPGAGVGPAPESRSADAALPSEAGLVDHLRTHPVEGTGWEEPVSIVEGDVERALEDAPMRIDATYTTAFLAHAPLESAAALAAWDGGRVTVWVGTQRPFGVREQIAAALELDEDDVRVIVPTAGGAYGGKHAAPAAVEAARLARESGHPVKVRWTHGEQFQHGYARPAAVIDVRCGAALDGTLLAWDFVNVNSGAAGLASPYRCASTSMRYQPAASPFAQGSYRALAATANHFARESHVDELARRVGADAVELRLSQLEDERLAAVLSAVAERAGWGRGEGALGIAVGLEKGARVATCAEVRVGEAGIEVLRIVTGLECGAVVDPENLRLQVEGATVMGLGAALFEALRVDRGAVVNGSFASYRVPRFRDVPEIDVVLLDRRDIPPIGAGETPIVAVAPAIANAVCAVTGERRTALPLDGCPRS
jgi:isoquinoline 1-oxidoreductase